jgi:diketogulonate reductase-like aldo/keto reductase
VFLSTKVWVANYPARAFAASVDDSLRKLRTDCYCTGLNTATPLAEQIEGLNSAVRAGKVRHIGVNNFNRALMAEVVRLSAPIVTNQCEYHPYLNHALLIDECRRLGISVIAYCGEAVGRVFTDPVLREMVRTRGRSVAQVVLRWLGQQEDVVALSRMTNRMRVASNLRVFDIALTAAEMATIHDLAQADTRIVSPSGLSPAWDAHAAQRPRDVATGCGSRRSVLGWTAPQPGCRVSCSPGGAQLAGGKPPNARPPGHSRGSCYARRRISRLPKLSPR